MGLRTLARSFGGASLPSSPIWVAGESWLASCFLDLFKLFDRARPVPRPRAKTA
jgi:hypothetical protein